MVRDWKRKRSDVPALRKGKLRWTPGEPRHLKAVFACISNQNVPWASLKAERLRSSSLLRWIGKDFALYRWKGISTIECPKPTAKPNSSNISPEQRLFDLLQIFWTKWCKVNINQSNTKSLATLPSAPQKQVNVILKLCIMTIHFFGGGLMILSSNKKNIAYSFPPIKQNSQTSFPCPIQTNPQILPMPQKTEHITYPKNPKGPSNGSVSTRIARVFWCLKLATFWRGSSDRTLRLV